ncbi:LuxR C-terminal-related transcriptional regulator [Micromonospora sp. LOL_025]|uniref:helix-turn-helix transcriptional regulator n=1 Tax=Micromonospora sp. LOL_025 TaxID=3345413 RepID=UPI003A8B9A96
MIDRRVTQVVAAGIPTPIRAPDKTAVRRSSTAAAPGGPGTTVGTATCRRRPAAPAAPPGPAYRPAVPPPPSGPGHRAARAASPAMTAPTLTTAANRPPTTPLVVLSTCAGIDAALAAASSHVLLASTLPQPWGNPLRRVDLDNIARGVRYRILLDERVRDLPTLALRLGQLAGGHAEVRTLANLPVDLTVIDGDAALLPVAPGAAGAAELAMFRLPSVVATAAALFERLWPAAAPLHAWPAELNCRERELLALLSAGCTDESSAARLGVSVRTVRRMMATIMDRLGARSRFQAGLEAAHRGLLTAPRHRPDYRG